MKRIFGSKKNEGKLNIIVRVIGIISLIVAVMFCISLFVLDMVPLKYFVLICVILGVVYLVMLWFSFKNRARNKINICCLVLYVVISIVMGIGIKYIYDTINFLGAINENLVQKEEYYVMVIENSGISDIDDLVGMDVGVYNSKNISKVTDELFSIVSCKAIQYDDVSKMFSDLSSNNLMGIVINDSIKNLFDDELETLGLKEIYKFSISIEGKDVTKVVDVTNKAFNIYVLGGDSYGDINSVSNIDVNMIVSVDPVNRKVLLTSIPRDYYVNFPSFGEDAYDKITHAGYYGIQESVFSVEKLLGVDINYYVKVNFSTIEGVIDAIGGVDVYSDFAFKERAFKQYYFTKGLNHLNGRQALAFARERKAFEDGDIQRVKNQQKVLTAIIDKVTSSTAMVTNFSEILNSVSSSFSTNLDAGSINRLVKMQLNDMREWKIDSQNLVGDDLNTYTYSYPGVELYVMKPDMESVNSSSVKIKQFLGES